MELGTKVKSLRAFSGVSVGTIGYVVEDYGTGITIGWDLPEKDRPFPTDLSFEEIGEMWAVNPKCPLRDGFDKETELEFLEIVEE